MLVAGRSGNCGVKRFLYAVMAGACHRKSGIPDFRQYKFAQLGQARVAMPARAGNRP